MWIVYFFLYVIAASSAVIVPEELPSVLNLVYSRIPQLKIGVDTKHGVGFRLGNNADFQILYEIGPQTRTRPIGKFNLLIYYIRWLNFNLIIT